MSCLYAVLPARKKFRSCSLVLMISTTLSSFRFSFSLTLLNHYTITSPVPIRPSPLSSTVFSSYFYAPHSLKHTHTHAFFFYSSPHHCLHHAPPQPTNQPTTHLHSFPADSHHNIPNITSLFHATSNPTPSLPHPPTHPSGPPFPSPSPENRFTITLKSRQQGRSEKRKSGEVEEEE